MVTPPYSYTDRSQLPNDVEELKDIIEYQWKEFAHYKQQTDLLIQQLMQKIESLEQEVAALKRNRFGQRSEKSKKEKGSPSFSKNKEGKISIINKRLYELFQTSLVQLWI